MKPTDLVIASSSSTSTVKGHVRRLLSKLGLASRDQAVIFAYEVGLVTLGEAENSPAPDFPDPAR